MKYLYPLILSFFLYSCSQKDVLTIKFKKIEPLESIKFPLDSLTPDYFHGLELVNLDGKDYFTLLNDLTSTIYYYDFETRNLDRLLSFDTGDKGISRGAMSYYHIGEDSIFLFGNKLTSYMVDLEGNIIDKYNLLDLSLRQSLYSSSKSPALFLDGKIYYNSLIWGMYEKDYFPLLSYSLEKKEVSLLDPIPEVYIQNGDWGKLWYDYAYQVLDKRNNRIIYSFPASNTLFIRESGEIGLKEINGSRIFDPILPPFENTEYVYDSDEWNREMNNTAIFKSILIDSNKDLLLRAYLKPINSSSRNSKRSISLVKYNLNSLEVLEVLELPYNNYDFENSFFKDSFLYVRKLTQDEDFIVFEKFSI
jgi:hypothetical protein